MVQLSQPYMTTGKTTALTRWTFISKVMSLLFNMLSKLVITFLPRSKHLLISWLQSPSAVILEPKKIKSVAVSIVSHLFAMKWWDKMPWSPLTVSMIQQLLAIWSLVQSAPNLIPYKDTAEGARDVYIKLRNGKKEKILNGFMDLF